MAIQRRINFSGAVHEMRAERTYTPTPLRSPDGGYNKRAILKEAHRRARMLGRTGGLSFREKLALSLRGVWRAAMMEGSRPYSPSQAARRASRLFSTGARA